MRKGIISIALWLCLIMCLTASAGAAKVDLGELGLTDGIWYMDATLTGGTGKASIASPARITVTDGQAVAGIIFSSPYYDYMIVDGVTYYSAEGTGSEEGHSVFEIPVDAFGYEMPVVADTIAMSTPHEIEYTIYLDPDTCRAEDEADEAAGNVTDAADEASAGESLTEDGESDTTTEASAGESLTEDSGSDTAAAGPGESLTEEAGAQDAGTQEGLVHDIFEIDGLTYDHSMETWYATQFAVDYYDRDCRVLTIEGDGSYLVVPDESLIPAELPDGVRALTEPQNIYLVATSAMDFFAELKALNHIRLSGTDESGWYIPEAAAAMESGDILYAGKYSAPDYETIVAEGCDLAIESTMIYHTPQVQEQLENFGITVMVERSSYETHPLGRSEWIRFYGALVGEDDAALAAFEEQMSKVEAVIGSENTGQTVAFFAINTNGSVTVRKSGDYISKIIELAGGVYAFPDLGGDDNALSTVNIQMEEFYAGAREADVLIYNTTIEGQVESLTALISKNELLASFAAVQSGNVCYTGPDLFQKPTGLADLIVDLNRILTGTQDEGLTYLHQMEE